MHFWDDTGKPNVDSTLSIILNTKLRTTFLCLELHFSDLTKLLLRLSAFARYNLCEIIKTPVKVKNNELKQTNRNYNLNIKQITNKTLQSIRHKVSNAISDVGFV